MLSSWRPYDTITPFPRRKLLPRYLCSTTYFSPLFFWLSQQFIANQSKKQSEYRHETPRNNKVRSEYKINNKIPPKNPNPE